MDWYQSAVLAVFVVGKKYYLKTFNYSYSNYKDM